MDGLAPRFDLKVIIKNRVAVREPVFLGDGVTAAPSLDQIGEGPKAYSADGLLREPSGRRSLAEVVGIGNEDRAASDAQHFSDSLTGIRNVVQYAKGADGIECVIAKVNRLRIAVD